MAARLRELLVLDLDRGHPRRLVAAHGVTYVEQAPEPGVGIGDEGCAGPLADTGGPSDHLRVAHEPGVRQPHVRRGDSVAGHVQGVEAGPVGDLRRNQVEHSGRQRKIAGPNPPGEGCAAASIAGHSATSGVSSRPVGTPPQSALQRPCCQLTGARTAI